MGTGYTRIRLLRAPVGAVFLLFSRIARLTWMAFFLHLGFGVTDNRSAQRERSVLILEAAGVLGVSRRTVYYRIREGRLQTIRTRGGSQRVLWSSIEALLRSMRPALAQEDATHPNG